MRTLAFAFAIAALSGSNGFAQASSSNLVNPGFEEGTTGSPPPGWHFGHGGSPLLFSAQTVAEACYSGKQCALVQSNDLPPAGTHAFLFQYVDARSQRTKQFRLRAAIRTRVSGPDGARLLVRIHRDDRSSCFFDNMTARPIKSGEWAFYEITGEVCAEAHDIELGMQLWGRGAAWLDDVAIAFGDKGLPLPEKTAFIPGF